MATVRLYRKGDRFYGEWYDPTRRPKKKYTALETTDPKFAERKLKRLEFRHIDGDFDPWNPKQQETDLVYLSVAIKTFLRSKTHLAAKTQKNYGDILGWFEQFCGSKCRVDRIDHHQIREFLESGERNTVSQRTYRTHLSAFYNWLRSEGVVTVNPCRKVSLGKVQKAHVAKGILREELDTVLAALRAERKEARKGERRKNRMFAQLVEFTFFCGLRRSEVINMRWTWVDWESKVLRIPSDETFSPKSKEEQKVRIVEPALKVLEQRFQDQQPRDLTSFVFTNRDGSALLGDFVSKKFKKWIENVLPPHRAKAVSFHSLRHGACLHILKQTNNIEVAKEHLRHSDISVTQVYSRLTESLYFDVLNGAMK